MPVMKKVSIYLTEEEHTALTLMAASERRKPAEQAAWEVGRRALQWQALNELDKAPPTLLTYEDCGLMPEGAQL